MISQAKAPERPYPKVRPLAMLEHLVQYRQVAMIDVANAIGLTESQLRQKMKAEDSTTVLKASWALGAPPWFLWFEINEETLPVTLRCCSTHPDVKGVLPAVAARIDADRQAMLDEQAAQKMAAQLFNGPDPDEDLALFEKYKPEEYSLPEPGYTALDPEPAGPRWPNTRTYQARHWDLSKRNPKEKQKGLPPGYQFTDLGWSWNAPYIVWVLKGWTLDMMLKRGYVKYSAKGSTPEWFVHHNTKKKLARQARKK